MPCEIFLLIPESDATFQITSNENEVNSFDELVFCHNCLFSKQPCGKILSIWYEYLCILTSWNLTQSHRLKPNLRDVDTSEAQTRVT